MFTNDVVAKAGRAASMMPPVGRAVLGELLVGRAVLGEPFAAVSSKPPYQMSQHKIGFAAD